MRGLTEAIEVVIFNAVVRFWIWLSSEGNEQPRQVCLRQGFCLVQVEESLVEVSPIKYAGSRSLRWYRDFKVQ